MRMRALLSFAIFGAIVAVAVGIGLTVIVTVCEEPVQLPPVDVGVTVYITD